MASKFSDGWLWASLAILGYFGSFAVHRQLVAIRQASEVTRHDKRPTISQQTEDALKLKALAELTQSPDQNIRAASVKIITDRAIREGPTWDTFIRDIAGLDIERRDKALACLRFLCPSFSGNKQAELVIRRHSTYKAIVDCLCNLLPEAQIAEDDPACRTQPERDALYFLVYIIDFDEAKASEAGVISRWLTQYPFGGSDTPRYKNKKKTIINIIDNGPFNKDADFQNSMWAMLSMMSNNPPLRKEMVEHGLLDVPKGKETAANDDWDMSEITRMYPYTDRRRSGIPVGTSSRPREESFEEQALRRRRREAMVLGEVGRPIERADIIERDSAALDGFQSQFITSSFDGVEDESEQPVAAVAEGEVEDLEILD